MTSKEHSQPAGVHGKHTMLARPAFGNFGRNEWAVLGAPCTVIKMLCDEVINALSPAYRCGYVDTAHQDETTLLPGRLSGGAILEYTDQINHRQLNYTAAFNSFKLRETFNEADVVLVNGNHHEAKRQVIIIYENKRASLQKRMDQLTDVRMILLANNAADVFDFVKDAIPGWQNLPLCRLDETEKIIAFFRSQMIGAKPVLNGLVLAGGKSMRMGFDKGSVNWHGKAQRYYMADMLKAFCDDVFISCLAGQTQDIDPQYNSLADTFTGLGPYGAILSAFREKPDSAWLVIACDLPLMDTATLQYLTDQRSTSSIATAYISAFDGLPEPLIAIWEPKSYPILLSFLAQGYSCPRKVLINSDSALLTPLNPDALTNVNTPEELEKIKRLLHQKMATN